MTIAITLAVLQAAGLWAALRLVQQPRPAWAPPRIPEEFITGEWHEAPTVVLVEEGRQ
jgi:hypothetical protein